MHTLETHPHIRRVRLCLDNDRAGLEAAQRITEKLGHAGYDDVSRMLPRSKDWSEDLLAGRRSPTLGLGPEIEPVLQL